MSDFKIIGPSNPEVGKEIIYKISAVNFPANFPGQVNPFGNNPFTEQVKWSIYVLEYGKWILKEKNNKTGPTANYTFTEVSLKRQGIRIVALFGNEKATLNIKPLDTIERKIVKVELCDALGNLQTKPFGYNQTVLARVHCLNLDNCTVHVTLWEDDAPGAGHNEINKNNKAITKSELVANGIADVKFILAPNFAKMADAKVAAGDKKTGEGKTHEYYVTAEVFRQKTKSSNNINVINPNNKTVDKKSTPQKPVAEKPVKPKPTSPAAKKGPSKKEEKGIKESSSGTIYDWGEAGFKAITSILPDPMDIVNSVAKLFTPDKKDEKKDEKKETCPNCDKPVTAEDLKKIFTQADAATLKKAADAYTKYMKDLDMNTCWNKAHFFAQAVVESGLKLKVRDGENFNWYYEKLPLKFSAFNSVEGRRNAELWGREIEDRRNPNSVDVTLENQKKIANWAYSSNFSKGKELGNTSPNDGWNFRGKGLVQLTGRKAYDYANKYTVKEGANILDNSDLVSTDIGIAVLSSMAFFKWKDINSITNGNSNTKAISRKVGNDIDGSHLKKQNAFADVTSKIFKINECKWKEEVIIAGSWHEPVDNPISTLYMQSGGGGRLGEHWGLFGNTRSGHAHQGLDLFAELGSNVYSCVKGVVYESKNHSGYGKTLTIKITDKEAFFNHRRDYKILYSSEGEIIQGQHFDKTQDIYLFYAHLREVLVTKGMSVDAGKVIAKSGVSGVVSGTCAPHLHFEIFTTLYAVGRGLNYRCNPGYYVHFKGASEQSKKEKDLQKKVSESGKINEVNGKN